MGQRQLICEWIPGPSFTEVMTVEVGVTVRVEVACTAKTTAGALAGSEPPEATCLLRLEVLGALQSIDAKLSPAAAAAGQQSSALETSRKRTITVTDRDELHASKLVTKPFITQANGAVHVSSATTGVSAEANLSLTPDWHFAVTIQRMS